MGTKESTENLLKMLYEKARGEISNQNGLKTTLRCVELVRILRNLGLFCFNEGDSLRPAVSYRGHTYILNIVDSHYLEFYSDVASFEDDEAVRQEMYSIFNNINCFSMQVNIYEMTGRVGISSQQYVGERKITYDEVMFMLKTIDETLREVYRMVRRNECLKDNVICV